MMILFSKESTNGKFDEKSCFRLEGDRRVFIFPDINNELIAEACEHLHQLYFAKDPPISVFFDICGKVVELMAYHYPSTNSVAVNNTKIKCSFILVVKDPIVLYRWSERGCLIINYKKRKRIYFSMCQMLHEETKDDSYILLTIMHIMCVSNQFVSLVYNTKAQRIEYWLFDQMGPYICRPDRIITPNKLIHYQKLLYIYYEQNQWIYKEERLVAIDTHYPGDFSVTNQTPNTYQEKAEQWHVKRGLRCAYESDEERGSKRTSGNKRKVNVISNATVLNIPRSGNAIIQDNIRATEEFNLKTSQTLSENVMKRYGVLDKDTFEARHKKVDSRLDALNKKFDDRFDGLTAVIKKLDEKNDRPSNKRNIDPNFDELMLTIDRRLESFSTSRNVGITTSDLVKCLDIKFEDHLKKIHSKACWDEEFNQSLIRQNRAFEQSQIVHKSTIDMEHYRLKTAKELELAERVGKNNADLDYERKKIDLDLYKKEEMQKLELALVNDTRNAALTAHDRSNLLHSNDRILNFKIESQRRTWDADDREQEMRFESHRVTNRIREKYASTNDELSIDQSVYENDLKLIRARKALEAEKKAKDDEHDD